jgi:glutamate 5-kinase
LLPAGVKRVDGAFTRGDAIAVRGPDGTEVARGLTAYDSDDATKIAGRSSADILSILGFGGRTEMIHRDDLVLAGSVMTESGA